MEYQDKRGTGLDYCPNYTQGWNVVLVNDGDYYFVRCLACDMAGPSFKSEKSAVEMLNGLPRADRIKSKIGEKLGFRAGSFEFDLEALSIAVQMSKGVINFKFAGNVRPELQQFARAMEEAVRAAGYRFEAEDFEKSGLDSAEALLPEILKTLSTLTDGLRNSPADVEPAAVDLGVLAACVFLVAKNGRK